MRKLAIFALLFAAAVIGVAETPRSDAAFHIARVYGAMGGAFGNPDIQYVELRSAAAGQNFVAGHDICFYDAAGAPWARFTFPASVANGASGASILIASSEFDAAWAAGSPDAVFSAANTVAIQGGADVNHPVPSPAGKVSFVSDAETNPALMCGGGVFLIDSVAYGAGYTGGVDFGAGPFATDMPTAGTDAIVMDGPVCYPLSCVQDNQNDYAITDVNVAGSHPRNNANQAGPISPSDGDGDGVPDTSDNCPAWPNPGQGLPPWTVPAGDSDCDGFTNTAEGAITTNPSAACGFTAGGPTTSDSWPADLVESNSINISDVLALKPVFATSVPPTSARLDIVPSGGISISDVLALKPFFSATCTP